MVGLLLDINRPGELARAPKQLPVYIFSGSEDPVSERTRGLKKFVQALKSAGVGDVTHRFYEGGRHEMLNETNRAEVHRDLVAWLDAKTA